MGKGGQEFCSFRQNHGKSLPDTLPQLVDPKRRLHPSFNVSAQPLQSLIKTVSTRGTSGLQERKCVSHERCDGKSNQGEVAPGCTTSADGDPEDQAYL